MWRLHRVALLGAVILACGRGSDHPPAIPDGPLGAAIQRGRALLLATRDSLPAHVGNRLRCTRVETIEYRVNDCFRRSMNGTPLSSDGGDMRDIVAYLWFLSRGVPIAPPPTPAGGANRLAKWAGFRADTAAGGRVYGSACAKCHGPDGQGTAVAPPVWGPDSYNIGAGLARVRTAAAFIRDNMPLDQPGTLSDQEAFDVAAYVGAHPRPDFPEKIHDWPNGDSPPDVAYPTEAARRKSP